MNDTLSSLRRLIHRKLSRYIITIYWDGDTFKHYTFKRNEAWEWVDAYPAGVDYTIAARY